MRKRLTIGIIVLTIVVSSLFLTYWFYPSRVIWTRNGIVATVHRYADSNAGTNWNVLVYIYQQSDMGYLMNTGYIALNGQGTLSHGNFCWNDGHNSCLSAPLNFNINETLTVEALNNGNFMLQNRQL